MAGRRWTSALYEFLRFGLKQAWACLFGGIAVFLASDAASFVNGVGWPVDGGALAVLGNTS